MRERNTKTKIAQLQEKKEKKRSENKEKYCCLLKTNTCRLTKWFSMFTVTAG